MQPQRQASNAMRAHHFVRQHQMAPDSRWTGLLHDVVEGQGVAVRPAAERQVGGPMFHEAAAHQLIRKRIATPGTRAQQQPGIFDAAGGQDVQTSLYISAPSVGSDEFHSPDLTTPGVRPQAYRTGVQEHTDVVGGFEALAVEIGEAANGALLYHTAGKRGAVQCKRTIRDLQAAHLGIIPAKVAETTDALRPLVVWLELLPVDGPTTVRNPLARFEIHRVERPAVGTPMVGIAAQIQSPRGIRGDARSAARNHLIDAAAAGLRRQAAVLQDEHAKPTPAQCECQGDAHSPRTDDADVSVRWGGAGRFSQVDEHREVWSRTTAEISTNSFDGQARSFFARAQLRVF